jgi:endoglucanase
VGSGGLAGLGGSGNGGLAGAGGSGSGGSTEGSGGLPWLKVVGNQLQVEATGQQVILRGVSIEGLDQQSKDSKHNVNGVIDMLTNKNDTGGSSPGWYPTLLRLPVDSANPISEINTLLKPAVDYATKKGLYVIVDLHYVDSPYKNQQTVTSFWTTVAPMFKDYSNVIYEPFNESSVQDTWATYKPTMQAWVDLIRAAAPKNLIFAGSPSWDQSMGDAATNPLKGDNIVYVVHMYYAHWKTSWNKTQVETCAKVHPVIMTEWGYSNDSGETETDPDISATYGKPMLEWLEGLGGGWTAWCFSNSWLPKMFTDSWTFRVGPREEGGFVKDWLYTNRNVKSPVTF